MTLTGWKSLWIFFMIFVLCWNAGIFSPVFAFGIPGYADAYPFLKWFYHQTCHQIPEKTVFSAQGPLLVCSRCTGIAIGALAGLFISRIIAKFRYTKTKQFYWILLAPMAADVAGAATGMWHYSKISALATGLLGGVAAAQLVYSFYFQINSQTQ